MAAWIHSRKGRITGTVVDDDGEWVRIRLDVDHHLQYLAWANQGRVDERGDILTVRKSHLTSVPESTNSETQS